MREKHTILVCPGCGKPGFVGPYYRKDNTNCLLCTSCNWIGDYTTVLQVTFWQKRVTHIQISWDIVDRIAYLYYGHETPSGMPNYEFVVQGECSNDSSYKFTVEPVVDSYDEKGAAKFRKSGEPGNLSNSAVLNILCQDGWLEPGEYLVEVCW